MRRRVRAGGRPAAGKVRNPRRRSIYGGGADIVELVRGVRHCVVAAFSLGAETDRVVRVAAALEGLLQNPRAFFRRVYEVADRPQREYRLADAFQYRHRVIVCFREESGGQGFGKLGYCVFCDS